MESLSGTWRRLAAGLAARPSWVSGWRGVVVVAWLALFVRGGVLAFALAGVGPSGDLQGDPDAYRRLAVTLRQTGTYGFPVVPRLAAESATPENSATTEDSGAVIGVRPTAFRPPLYPWVLSWMVVGDQVPAKGIAVLHLLLGVATAVGTYLAVAGLLPAGRGHLRAVLAAAMVTLDPLLLQQSTLVMTETLATALAVWVWWLVIQLWRRGRGGFAAGAVVGSLMVVGYFCRPVFLVWAGLLVIWLWCLAATPEEGSDRIAGAGRASWYAGSRYRWSAVGLAGVLSLAVAGWTARNVTQLGAAVWATTHGGYTLLLGNNASFYQYLRERSVGAAGLWGESWQFGDFETQWKAAESALPEQDGARPEVAREVRVDRMGSDWAWRVIRAEPGMFLRASGVRILRLWSPLPRVGGEVRGVSWLIGGYYLAIWLVAGISIWKWGVRGLRSPLGVGLLLAVALTCVHAIYWSNIRMRAPAMPIVIAAAVLVGARPRGVRLEKGVA